MSVQAKSGVEVGPPDVLTWRFDADGGVPNNSELAVVVMRTALPATAGAAAICERFVDCGWGGTWTYTVFDFHHFHPDAHEVLAVATGTADLQLGGPNGEVLAVVPGDVLVLPAGTGHCRLRASPDFSVCGAYPKGQEDYTIQRAAADDLAAYIERIAAVPLPESDPIHGKDGPLMDHWVRSVG